MVSHTLTCVFNTSPHNPQPLLLLLFDLFLEELKSKTAVDGSRGSVPNPEVTGRARTL
jgi:hypothetical protein